MAESERYVPVSGAQKLIEKWEAKHKEHHPEENSCMACDDLLTCIADLKALALDAQAQAGDVERAPLTPGFIPWRSWRCTNCGRREVFDDMHEPNTRCPDCKGIAEIIRMPQPTPSVAKADAIVEQCAVEAAIAEKGNLHYQCPSADAIRKLKGKFSLDGVMMLLKPVRMNPEAWSLWGQFDCEVHAKENCPECKPLALAEEAARPQCAGCGQPIVKQDNGVWGHVSSSAALECRTAVIQPAATPASDAEKRLRGRVFDDEYVIVGEGHRIQSPEFVAEIRAVLAQLDELRKEKRS